MCLKATLVTKNRFNSMRTVFPSTINIGDPFSDFIMRVLKRSFPPTTLMPESTSRFTSHFVLAKWFHISYRF